MHCVRIIAQGNGVEGPPRRASESETTTISEGSNAGLSVSPASRLHPGRRHRAGGEMPQCVGIVCVIFTPI